MTDDQIKHMVDRFLIWRLPQDFFPDNGISAARPNYAPNVPWEPTGTNLLDAGQAEEMVRYMIDGMPEHPMSEECERGVVAAAKTLWRATCEREERARKVEGIPIPAKWADPWDPNGGGKRQAARYMSEARAAISAYLATIGGKDV